MSPTVGILAIHFKQNPTAKFVTITPTRMDNNKKDITAQFSASIAIAMIKIKTSNKIKKLVATRVKLSVAYKNKGGKIDNIGNIQTAQKIEVVFVFFVHM